MTRQLIAVGYAWMDLPDEEKDNDADRLYVKYYHQLEWEIDSVEVHAE